MANAENRVSTLNGWFKEQYADAPSEVIPAQFRLQENINFGQVLQQGNKFHIPIVLQFPTGFTYALAGAGAFALNQAGAGQTLDATVQGSQVLLRESIDYESAKLASSSKTAFGQVTSRVVRSMTLASRKRLEIEFFYGQMGLASGTGAVVLYGSATTSKVVTIAAAEWAAGIWAGMEGAQLEIRDSTGATLRGYVTLKTVDLVNKRLTFNEIIGSTGLNIQANDCIWFKGAYGNECAGIHKILSNTGTLFGIDASQWTLWAGAAYANGSAALTFASIQKTLNAMLEKGCENDVVALISHKAWSNVLTQEAARRVLDSSYSEQMLKNGGRKLSFFEQTGKVDLMASTYVKEGYAFLLSKEDWMRIGATDLTFALPDSDGKEFIRPLADNAGFELRAWSYQAPFCKAPGRSALVTGIVNN